MAARHQIDYCCSGWNMSLLLVPLTAAAASNVFVFSNCFFCCASVISEFVIFFPCFLPSCLDEKKTQVSWGDDELALFVSYCLTHRRGGWGTLDQSREGPAGRVARHQTDYK